MVAPRILWRYVLRDVLLHTLLGLLICLLLLVVQNTLRFLEVIVQAGLGLDALGRLLRIALPTYASYAIPTSLLFGVLLSFGRMSADGEILAMRASGVSVPGLLPPVLLLGALGTLLTGWILFQIEPGGRYEMRVLARQIGKSARLLQENRFRELGSRVLYVHRVGDESCPYRGVMLADLGNPERTVYVSSECGSLPDARNPDALALDLVHGSIHFSEPRVGRYRRIDFERMHTEIDLERYLAPPRRVDGYAFATLLELDRRRRAGETVPLDAAELQDLPIEIQRRLSFPAASLVLAVLAVPLGIRPLRAGRSAGALTAVAVMGLYWVLFRTGELAAGSGWVPAWAGLWIPNLLVVSLTAVLILRSARGDG